MPVTFSRSELPAVLRLSMVGPAWQALSGRIPDGTSPWSVGGLAATGSGRGSKPKGAHGSGQVPGYAEAWPWRRSLRRSVPVAMGGYVDE